MKLECLISKAVLFSEKNAHCWMRNLIYALFLEQNLRKGLFIWIIPVKH